jgi:hypothetical protein
MIKVSEQILIIEEVMRAQKPESECSGKFSRTMGLPCWHRIRQIAVEGKRLELNDFNRHWHLCEPKILAKPRMSLDQEFQLALVQTQQTFENSSPHQKALILQSLTPTRNDHVPTIKAFDVAKTVGRPKEDQSTRRIPSGFEIADGPTISRKRALKRVMTQTTNKTKEASLGSVIEEMPALKYRKIAPKSDLSPATKINSSAPAIQPLLWSDDSDSEKEVMLPPSLFPEKPRRRYRLKPAKLKKGIMDCINCGGNHYDCDKKTVILETIFDEQNQGIFSSQFLVIDGNARGIVEPDFEKGDKEYHGHCEICNYFYCEHVNLATQFKSKTN